MSAVTELGIQYCKGFAAKQNGTIEKQVVHNSVWRAIKIATAAEPFDQHDEHECAHDITPDRKNFSNLQSQPVPKGAYEPNTNDPQTTKKDIDYVKCIDSLTVDLDFLTIATYLQSTKDSRQ